MYAIRSYYVPIDRVHDMKLTIYRYNPETDREPYLQDFELEDGRLNLV